MRLFAALEPPPEVVEAVETLLEPRREHGPEIRWTMPETWHVTLAFMGGASADRLEDLEERLSRATARRSPFTLHLAGGGAFPDAARARVLYAGVRGEPEALTQLSHLATGVRAAAAKAGTDPDGGRFRPHVTLGRTRRPDDVVRWVRVLDLLRSPAWPVTEVALVESFLGEGPRGRPRYEVRSVHPLGRLPA